MTTATAHAAYQCCIKCRCAVWRGPGPGECLASRGRVHCGLESERGLMLVERDWGESCMLFEEDYDQA